jgi:hypothetical protein
MAFALVALAILSLACSANLGGPSAPGPEITPDQNFTGLEDIWASAFRNASHGSVTMVLNEAQLTAYLQTKLAADPNNTLQNAQVFLRDGKIQVYGLITTDAASTSALISLRPVLDDEGSLQLEVVEAKVGPMDLPEQLLSTVSRMISEALTGQIGKYATGVRIEEVLIGDGQLAMRLRLAGETP